jgi:hypothetical protein
MPKSNSGKKQERHLPLSKLSGGDQAIHKAQNKSSAVPNWRRIPIHMKRTEGDIKAQESKPLAELIFTNQDEMDRILHPISDAIEGTVVKRKGHNFSYESYLRAHPPPSFAQLTKQLQGVGARYIIAHLEGDLNTKRHELRHAMFFIDEEYRKSTTHAWESLSAEDQIRVTRLLTSIGYNPKVHIDEFQAYQFTERKNMFGLRDPPPLFCADQRDRDWMAGKFSTRWTCQI